MRLSSRILLVLASLSVLLLFVSPMWKIYLDAPQYPEGLEMHIWVNKIGGNSEFTLQNFNILNHYIGMAPIHAESFKELVYMPYIALFFMVSGIFVALANSKKLLIGWLLLLFIGASAGLLDFYFWLQKFGTELDPNAPIKVPGMTYIPPFIGNKTLLNFDAFSFPHLGSLGLAIPMLVGIIILLADKGKKRVFKVLEDTGWGKAAAAVLIGASVLTSCSSGPRPINYNEDQCGLCKMAVTDRGYGSEMVTSKGKIYTFDSVECLARFVNTNESDGSTLLVTDYAGNGELVDVRKAYFLLSENMPSPMGGDLTAFAEHESAKKILDEKGGEILNWESVLKVCR